MTIESKVDLLLRQAHAQGELLEAIAFTLGAGRPIHELDEARAKLKTHTEKLAAAIAAVQP